MRFLFQFILLLLLLAVLAPVAFGGNVEDGLAAAESGDFKMAHSLWLAEAEKGNPVVACAWYSLALENGEATAQGALETTKKKMTEVEIEISEQIAEQLRMDIWR